ncbi:MAG TPA: class I SAM-dependent methyltransferase [Verrucomicrobiae bacterium]|nr:class I SAM-dependent methyltransferase [Verrucomicrobiae bacterium]
MELEYEQWEDRIREGYRSISGRYRLDDEIEVTTPNHRRLSRLLRTTCLSFPTRIVVLDVGCGTGRYFHCLQNVAHLVGMDVSNEMLAAARNPVRSEHITAEEIELRCGNVYFDGFPPRTFDFIYSLGMFGHLCPVTVQVCNRFWTWLKPGGKLLFNVVDFRGLPWCQRLRRRVRALLYPFLSQRLRGRLDRREKEFPLFAPSRNHLIQLVSGSRFPNFSVRSFRCESPLWSGRHLECLATKESE